MHRIKATPNHWTPRVFHENSTFLIHVAVHCWSRQYISCSQIFAFISFKLSLLTVFLVYHCLCVRGNVLRWTVLYHTLVLKVLHVTLGCFSHSFSFSIYFWGIFPNASSHFHWLYQNLSHPVLQLQEKVAQRSTRVQVRAWHCSVLGFWVTDKLQVFFFKNNV